MNNNYPYDVFNQAILEQQRIAYEMQMREYDLQQRKTIADATKAANDFIDALEKIAPPYQDLATGAIFSTLISRSRR